MSIKSWLRYWLLESTVEEPPPSLNEIVGRYEDALSILEERTDTVTLLVALTQRDQISMMLAKGAATSAIVQRLADLDHRLRQAALQISDANWDAWRKVLNPPPDRWWWRLDEAQSIAEEKHNLPWVLLAGVLMTVTLSLAVEIIRRMWDGGPDLLSAVSTVLTLALTSSPLTKQGRELASWLMDRVRLPSRLRGETMMGMATLAFVVMLLLRLMLPTLAITFNNLGHSSLRAGNLTAARRAFQRAVALDPERAEGYYHLGVVYEEIGRTDDAITWYERALEHDLDLGVAYSNLGRLYVLQGEYGKAIRLLQAGLRRTVNDTPLERVTHYTLYKNLGWAYYAQEQYQQAKVELEQSLMLESELNTAQKSAAPHYYLALVYEALEMPAEAVEQWKDCLRYIVHGDPDQSGWERTALTHLEELTGESQ